MIAVSYTISPKPIIYRLIIWRLSFCFRRMRMIVDFYSYAYANEGDLYLWKQIFWRFYWRTNEYIPATDKQGPESEGDKT